MKLLIYSLIGLAPLFLAYVGILYLIARPHRVARDESDESRHLEDDTLDAMRELVGEFNSLVARTVTRIVDREQKLRHLNGEADRHIKELKQVVRTILNAKKKEEQAAPQPPPPSEPETESQPRVVGLAGTDSREKFFLLGPNTRNSQASSAGTTRDPASGHSRVYAMADQGMSIADIARKESLGMGEVELILNLRGKK